MKAVLRNMTPGQKQSLREFYQEQKDMSADVLQKLLAPPKRKSKRKKPVTGGCDGCSVKGGCPEYESYEDSDNESCYGDWDTQSVDTTITEILK